MNATIRALDALAAQDRAAGGTGSDYRSAQRLGIERQQISKYRHGRDQMGDSVAIRAAELLGWEPIRLVGEIHAERARDERARELWRRLARAAGSETAGVALAVMMAAAGLGYSPAASAHVRGFADLYNGRNFHHRRPRRRRMRPGSEELAG